MPKCSFKKCKNHSSRTLKKDGISYFRFPRDPVRCGEWISIIARQRSEEFFRATQGSVVCSQHFLESDQYITTKGITRLLKTAVPQVDTNDHDEDESSRDKKSNEQYCLHQPQIKIETMDTEALKNPTSPLSIRSILDNPNKTVVKKEIIACKRRIRLINNRICNLHKLNVRLKKRYYKLKKIMSSLNKRQTVDQAINTDVQLQM